MEVLESDPTTVRSLACSPPRTPAKAVAKIPYLVTPGSSLNTPSTIGYPKTPNDLPQLPLNNSSTYFTRAEILPYKQYTHALAESIPSHRSMDSMLGVTLPSHSGSQVQPTFDTTITSLTPRSFGDLQEAAFVDERVEDFRNGLADKAQTVNDDNQSMLDSESMVDPFF